MHEFQKQLNITLRRWESVQCFNGNQVTSLETNGKNCFEEFFVLSILSPRAEEKGPSFSVLQLKVVFGSIEGEEVEKKKGWSGKNRGFWKGTIVGVYFSP